MPFDKMNARRSIDGAVDGSVSPILYVRHSLQHVNRTVAKGSAVKPSRIEVMAQFLLIVISNRYCGDLL